MDRKSQIHNAVMSVVSETVVTQECHPDLVKSPAATGDLYGDEVVELHEVLLETGAYQRFVEFLAHSTTDALGTIAMICFRAGQRYEGAKQLQEISKR